MSVQLNQSLSVDCVVFGFDGKALKVLLIERRYYREDPTLDRLKLPGAMMLIGFWRRRRGFAMSI